MNEPKRELLRLIRSKLNDGMTADEVVEALRPMFFEVEDDWQEFEIMTVGDANRQVVNHRSLLVRIPRESMRITSRPAPDRSAGIEP